MEESWERKAAGKTVSPHWQGQDEQGLGGQTRKELETRQDRPTGRKNQDRGQQAKGKEDHYLQNITSSWVSNGHQFGAEREMRCCHPGKLRPNPVQPCVPGEGARMPFQGLPVVFKPGKQMPVLSFRFITVVSMSRQRYQLRKTNNSPNKK